MKKFITRTRIPRQEDDEDDRGEDIRINDIIVWTFAFIGLICAIAAWFHVG